MTGWQGNEGGQGGWNPQQDPYGQQYGADPYGGQQQYGADPYSGGIQYDPYGQQQQYGADPYGGQYPPSGQFPAYQAGFGPPPPKKRSKLPIVLSIVAIVAIVGAVITIVLLNRKDDPAQTAGPGDSSSAKPPPSSPSAPPSSKRQPSTTTKPAGKDGWTAVELPWGKYQVPAEWKSSTADRASGLAGVTFKGGAEVGSYNCGGSNYFRGFTAGGDVQSKSGTPLEVEKTVTDFANSFAREYYREPKVESGTPKSTTVDGKKAATVTIKLTVTPTKPDCEATSGEVAVVGVLVEEGGKATGVRMVVVVNDLDGGPADPPGLPDPLAEDILETLTVS